MGSKSIKINEYELQNCEGNLKNLIGSWSGVPKISEKSCKQSTGFSAESAVFSCHASNQTKKNFDALLNNSLMFFEAVGISFEKADQEAANAIKGQ